MKKTKNIALLVLLLITSLTNAQQMYIGSGFGKANFDGYENSSGENTLDNSGYSKPPELSFEGGFLFTSFEQRVKFDIGFHYSKYKINTSFYSGNVRIPTTYNLSYFGLKGGLNVALLRWERLKLNLHPYFTYDWLTYGTNAYRNVLLDIYKEKTLDRTLLSYHIGLGLEYRISDKISTYVNYNIAKSIIEENKDSTAGEKYSLDRRAITIGLLFDISQIINWRLWERRR